MGENVNQDFYLICQENSGLKLRYAVADDRRKSVSVPFTFLNNVMTLWNLGCQVPDNIGDYFTPFHLNQRNAKWHKDFHSNSNKQKVERAHRKKEKSEKK